jgi:hypothetical protein
MMCQIPGMMIIEIVCIFKIVIFNIVSDKCYFSNFIYIGSIHNDVSNSRDDDNQNWFR